MNQEEFEALARTASKQYASKKKVASQPETQFLKGALWAWDALMAAKDRIWYEERLRSDVMDREGKVDGWKESLISELADMLAERDAMMDEIRTTGRLLDKTDKNEHVYKESNPLYVHVKTKEQSISVWRDKLGLSNTVAPQRIKESPKQETGESDPMYQFMKGRKK